jgi:hypothetical protein
MSQTKKDYLKQLFYKKLKASVGQRGLYEHMLVDKDKIDDHPSWREVRAWHSAQRVSALSRPIKAKSKSVANTTKRAFPFAVRTVGDAKECGAKFVAMIRQVRTGFYGNPEATDWPIDKMLVYVDGGNEFSNVYSTVQYSTVQYEPDS